MFRGEIRRGIEDILATFPDWHMEIIELIAKGDSVVARFTVTGTHRGVGKFPMNGGMLVGVQPTGKHFSVEHILWMKLGTARSSNIQQLATTSASRAEPFSTGHDIYEIAFIEDRWHGSERRILQRPDRARVHEISSEPQARTAGHRST
jgi:hypothetical protein